MQGTARALPLMPRQSREELQRQARRAPSPAPCSQPRSQPRAAPLAADTCNPAHSSCTATPGITGITLRVPCTGIEPVHLSDTYRNREGAEAPDTHQALLLLLGKAYRGCFHHLLYFSLSHGCHNLKLSCFLFNQTFINAK